MAFSVIHCERKEWMKKKPKCIQIHPRIHVEGDQGIFSPSINLSKLSWTPYHASQSRDSSVALPLAPKTVLQTNLLTGNIFMPHASLPSQTPSGFMEIAAPVNRLQGSLARGAKCAKWAKMCVLPSYLSHLGPLPLVHMKYFSLCKRLSSTRGGVQCRVPIILSSVAFLSQWAFFLWENTETTAPSKFDFMFPLWLIGSILK